MSDLGSRLLAAVTSNRSGQQVVGNAKSRCYGVTTFNSLQKSGVTSSPLVTPELFSKISAVTPLHPNSARWDGQEQDCISPKGNPAHAQSDAWTDAAEERAAIAEHDGGAPRAWAEALARLDPANPPCDVPTNRWQRFIDDCGRFLDQGWASRAEALGWGPLDLFGCDRERPLVRREYIGLLWLLNGGMIRELRRDGATIETPSGAHQSYQRRPVEVGRVALAWELSP
jgi:hypothetical protein